MIIQKYRWQDFAISPGRAPFELIATLLIVLGLGLGMACSNGAAQGPPRQQAGRPSPAVEHGTSLAEAAKPRVLPKAADDWLDRGEINRP